MYSKECAVNPNHIDAQGIVDGLYYPFYLEDCRHSYVKEVLGFDVDAEAARGVNMVLSEYTLRFRRPLKSGDLMTVTCRGYRDATKLHKLHFEQKILVSNQIHTEAIFTATCIRSTGGRPFIPDLVAEALNQLTGNE